MKDLKTRTVLLLGRRPSVEWGTLRAALCRDEELVVLSLGYPVSAGQRAALLQAQDLAEEMGAWFDALLVTSMQRMFAILEPDDVIHVAARGWQGKRLRAALGAVGR
jgi:hypothetical protein